MPEDFVDRIITQWEAELPAVDFGGLKVFSRFARLGQLASRRMMKNQERFGLTETQFNLLAALHRVGAPYQLAPKDLARQMLLSSGAITYVIDQLEKAGRVARLDNGKDRRMLLIELTAAGKEAIETAMRAHLEMCAELLAPLDDREREALVSTLRKLLLHVDETPVATT